MLGKPEDEFRRVVHACVQNRVVFHTFDVYNFTIEMRRQAGVGFTHGNSQVVSAYREHGRELNAGLRDLADESGSTGKIIQAVEQSPPGTKWAVGTELHLVNRLKHEHPEQEIHFLSPVVCMCATMYRIDLAHLCWSLENLAAGNPVNVIEVDEETSRWSLVALERMLEVTQRAVRK